MDIDAKLSDEMSRLRASERNDIFQNLHNRVGNSVSKSFVKYCLDVTDWNYDRALSAFYDISSENSPYEGNTPSKPLCCNWIRCSQYQNTDFSWYDAAVIYSPSSTFTSDLSFSLCIRNSGIKVWPDNCYIKSQSSPYAAPHVTKGNSADAALWLPIGPFNRLPLPILTPGQHYSYQIKIETPSIDDCYQYFKHNTHLIGAVSMVLEKNDEVFGDVIYFTLIKSNSHILGCPGVQTNINMPSTSQDVIFNSSAME